MEAAMSFFSCKNTSIDVKLIDVKLKPEYIHVHSMLQL